MFDFCFFSLVIELDEIIAGFIAGIYRNYSRFVDDENDCTVLTYRNSTTYESVPKSRENEKQLYQYFENVQSTPLNLVKFVKTGLFFFR